MPVTACKKPDKLSKAKQRATEDKQPEENAAKHAAPEGYDENEDLLAMEIPPQLENVMDTEGSVGERLMISHIVVENFKSYFGTQTIGPFHKNFTTVIGPNGSGKSNVIDALLFVFGYRASKIRSKKLSVLIHSSAGRDNIPSCTVSVYFQRIVDVSRNECDVRPRSQFFASRTAFRDNSSRYTLNGKAATFKEISITLRRCGIDLVHNRFLILQGEVEQISLMKPKAENDNEEGMLEYLEDIIGSSRLKSPINKLLYKLDGIQEQRAAQLLRLKYAEKERVSLVEPAKKVVSILRLETASSLVQNKIYCCKRLKIVEKVGEIVEEHQQCLHELSTAQSLLKAQNEQNKKLRSEKKELEKALDKIQQDLLKVQAELGDQNKNISKGKNDIDRLKKRDKKLSEDIVKKQKEIADLEHLPQHAEERIEVLKATLQESERQIKENTSFIQQKLGEIEEKTFSLKAERKTVDVELAKHSVVEDEVNSKLSLAQEELSCLQADEDIQHKELAGLNEKLIDLKQNLTDRTRECNEANEMQPKLVYERARLEAECNSLRNKEAALVDQIHEIQVEMEESKQSAEDFQSSNHLLQTLMQQKQQGHISGIYGRLGDLGAIDLKYDVAISTTCGSLDNIVVDTVNTAQQCIEFLKRERLGTSTFIALDKQQKYIPNIINKSQTPENVPRLFDLIRVVDDQVLPAFYYALNETLVADDIVSATRIAMPTFTGGKRWRTVTLNGEVVDVSGTMTGGGNNPRRGKIGQSVKVDTSRTANDSLKDLTKMNQQLKELELRLIEVRQNLAKSDDEFRRKKDELNRINKVATSTKAEVKNLEKSITLIQQQVSAQEQKKRRSIVDPIVLGKAQDRVKSFKKESDAISNVTNGLRLRFISLTEQIDNIEKQILGAEKNKLAEATERKKIAEKSIANEKSAIASNKRNMSKAQKCMTDLEADLEQTALSIQLEQSKLCSSEAGVEELQVLVTQHLEEIKKAEESFKDAMNRGKCLNSEELKLQSHIKELDEKCQAVGCKIKELQSKVAVIDKQISKLPFYSKKDLDGMPDEVKNVNHDKLLDKIFSEDDLTDATDGQEQSGNSSDVEMNEINDNQENLITSSLQQQKTSAIAHKKLPKYSSTIISQFDIEVLEQQLNKLDERRSRSNNKDANMGVLNDYNERVKNYNIESELFQKISKQRDLHREFCQKLKNMRLHEFMEGFRKIGIALKDMYQMITMGGDASLDLVDSLDPFSEGISFGVRPPKKSWKQIVNLSGGEKTLASLAFVFGLHSYRPTPLYVMDEIDAALDFRNVSIISSYILEKTKNAQFVVISLRNNMFERGDRIVGIYKIYDCTYNAVLDPKAAERERKKNSKALKEFTKKRISGQSNEDRTLIEEISMNNDIHADEIRNVDVMNELSLSPVDETPRISLGPAKRRLFTEVTPLKLGKRSHSKEN